MDSSRTFRARSASPRQPGDRSVVPLTTGRPELLVDGSDDRFRGLVHDLLAFGSRLREIRDALGGLIGLSGPAYTVMIAIAHLASEPSDETTEVNVMSVARHLNVSQPFVTAEVRKLAAAGLVDKVASLSDRRSVSLTVTDRARQLLAELSPSQQLINDALFASLDRADFERLAAITSNLIADSDRALALAADHAPSTTREGGAA